METPSRVEGGYLPQGLLSPPLTNASSAQSQLLPRPRSHPLNAGGPKESSFIMHVDHRLLHINRRYAKRMDSTDRAAEPIRTEASEGSGYDNFAEAAKDVDSLIDIIWVSGTPSLQVPYLLSVALLVVSFLPSFKPAPRTLLRLLRKLDYVFASLLQGHDLDTWEPLPGFDTGWRVSGTEKVRLKSIVERTRLCVAEVVGGGAWELEPEPELELEPEPKPEGVNDDNAQLPVAEDGEDRYGIDVDDDDDGDTAWDMEISGVYDKTIVELGDMLKGSPIGILG